MGAGIASSALAVGLAAIHMPNARSAALAPETPANVESLREALVQVENCLVPAERKVLMDTYAEELDELRPAVLWVLNQPGHELFEGTTALAAALQVDEAVPALDVVAWSGSGRPRRPALCALDRLRPLPESDIAHLLRSDDSTLELAGLQILKVREALPAEILPTVLTLLASVDEPVRQAAFAIVPESLSAQWISAVFDLLEDDKSQSLGERLLARLEPNPETVHALTDLLAIAAPEQQQRLIATLDRYAAEPPVREQLWNIVESGQALQVRVAALGCLERVGDTRPLPLSAADWPPALRFQAAKLRTGVGDPMAFDLLIDMVAEGVAEDSEMAAAAGQSRVLLGRLAGLPPHAEVAQFAEWREQQAEAGDPASSPSR